MNPGKSGLVRYATKPTPEANRYGVGSRPCLELGQQVADVALDRLLGEEEPLPDLAVHEAVRDQLKHLDLAHRRLLLELAERAPERDHLGRDAIGATASRNRFEAA